MIFTDCSWSRQIRRHNPESHRRRTMTEGCTPCHRHTDVHQRRTASGGCEVSHLHFIVASQDTRWQTYRMIRLIERLRHWTGNGSARMRGHTGPSKTHYQRCKKWTTSRWHSWLIIAREKWKIGIGFLAFGKKSSNRVFKFSRRLWTLPVFRSRMITRTCMKSLDGAPTGGSNRNLIFISKSAINTRVSLW